VTNGGVHAVKRLRSASRAVTRQPSVLEYLLRNQGCSCVLCERLRSQAR
jgi:hypothetical protein